MNKVAENELKKAYYSIGEVADMFGVSTSLIRFWHKEFSVIQPKINKKGNRLFTPKDIINYNKIYNLVKVQGFTLEGARKALKQKKAIQQEIKEEQHTNTEVILKLENIKSRLLKMKYT